MSSYADLITGLKARVDTVANVGLTHAYQRFDYQQSIYLDNFMTTINGVDQIRGWMVTLDEREPIGTSERISFDLVQRTFNLLIFGVMGVSDADNTEATFIDLGLSIMDAVEGRVNLGAAGVFDIGPPSMRMYQLRMFGSTLCHTCEIVLSARMDHYVEPVAG